MLPNGPFDRALVEVIPIHSGIQESGQKTAYHDLEAALESAQQNGLAAYIDVTAHDRDQLQRANRLYSKKEFEYFESLETIWDPLDFDVNALASFAQRLYDAIEQPVWTSPQPI